MDEPREADVTAPYSLLRYGIGGFGTGGTSQIADAQGGRGGVGMRYCRFASTLRLDGEQLGSVGGVAGHALQSGKGIAVGVRRRETVR